MALVEKLNGKLRLPVVGAPLFIVSGPELVIQSGYCRFFPSS